MPNRKLHTIVFHMVDNVVVCTVGPLNSTKIGFGRSAKSKEENEQKYKTTMNITITNRNISIHSLLLKLKMVSLVCDVLLST